MTGRPVIDTEAADALAARISARIDTGISAARYDGDEGSSTSTSSHPERQAMKADVLSRKAERDWREQERVSADAIRHLAELQAAVATITTLSRAYPLVMIGQPTIPGLTPCPPSQCVAHWAAGLSIKTVTKPKRKRCRSCHDFFTEHGDDYPPLVLRAVSDLGGKSGPLGAKVWDHPLVLRAWDSSGWIAKPAPQKRSA